MPLRRFTGLAMAAAAVLVVAAWLVAGLSARKAPSTTASAGSLDDLLMDLQLIPLDGQAPRPFALPALDGRRVALGDLAGRPALLYFWATW
jgi:cytochrome oxidase Cu insertion factor (SCO1/SenC/PrrC family)